MRKAIPVICLAGLLALAPSAPLGCQEDRAAEREAARRLQQQHEREREELQRQAEEARRQREQDRRVLEARRSEAESDATAAVIVWAVTALALAVVIVLLARERRIRNVVTRLLALLLGKGEVGHDG
jgi:Flp pilus assembly protein TadB